VAAGLVSFGSFIANQHGYDLWELPFFMLLGVVGGLLGALFNALNTRLTRWRMRFVNRPLTRALEVRTPHAARCMAAHTEREQAILVTVVTSAILFVIPYFVHSCQYASLALNAFSISLAEADCVWAERCRHQTPTTGHFTARPCVTGTCSRSLLTHVDRARITTWRPSCSTPSWRASSRCSTCRAILGLSGSAYGFRGACLTRGRSYLSLSLFFVIYFLLAVWTFGIAVPSGVFIPCFLIGTSTPALSFSARSHRGQGRAMGGCWGGWCR
jgi:hypothetical protein